MPKSGSAIIIIIITINVNVNWTMRAWHGICAMRIKLRSGCRDDVWGGVAGTVGLVVVHLCNLLKPYCPQSVGTQHLARCKQTDEGLLPRLSRSFWAMFNHQGESLFVFSSRSASVLKLHKMPNLIAAAALKKKKKREGKNKSISQLPRKPALVPNPDC